MGEGDWRISGLEEEDRLALLLGLGQDSNWEVMKVTRDFLVKAWNKRMEIGIENRG